MRICEKCQKEILPGARFCFGCGTPVEADTEPVTEPAADTSAKRKKPKKQKKSSGALAATLVILLCFAIVSAVLVYRFLPDGSILPTVTREEDARRVEVEVTDSELLLNLEMSDASYGNVVLVEEKDGSFTVLPQTVWTDTGVQIRLEESCTVIVVDKSEDYSDVAYDTWGEDYIDYLSARGIVKAQEGDLFAPEALLSRQDLALILWKIAGRPEPETLTSFTDVTDAAYMEAVSYMAESGVSVGYSDGTFKPDAAISRQQFITMLYRFADYNDHSVKWKGDQSVSDFADGDQVSSWAVEPMEWALNKGVIQAGGQNLLQPGDSVTRAQACELLFCFLQEYFA